MPRGKRKKRGHTASNRPPPAGAVGRTGEDPASAAAVARVFRLSLLVLFGLAAAGAFLPGMRLWGVNHLAYYPLPVRIGALLLAVLAFVPAISRWAYQQLLAGSDVLRGGSRTARASTVIVPLLAFIAFALFPTATYIYGDGQVMANDLIVTLSKPQPVSIAEYFRVVVLDEPIAPGTYLLNYIASRTLLVLGGAHPMTGWRLFYALVGGLFVLALLLFMRKNHAPREVAVIVLPALLLSGGIVLFFGYIETYTPMIFVSALYVMTALRTIHRQGTPVFPLLCLVVAVLLHLQSLLLVPSFLYVFTGAVIVKQKHFSSRPIAIALAVITITAAIAAGRHPQLQRYFLSLLGTKEAYGIISPAHVVDILNEVLLIFPTGLLFVAMTVSVKLMGRPAGVNEKGAEASRERPPDPKSKAAASEGLDRTLGRAADFALLLLVPSVAFMLLFCPELGMARDWDLFTLPVFGLFVFAFIALRRFLAFGGAAALLARFAVPAFTTAAVLVISWIGINADTARSVARFEDVLKFDKTGAGYAYEILGLHHNARGNRALEMNALKRAYSESPNPRYLLKLSRLHFQNGDTLQAAAYLRRSLFVRPQNEGVRQTYVEMMAALRNMDDLIDTCLRCIELRPEDPFYHFYLGKAYFTKRMVREGTEAFERCRQLNPKPHMIREMDRLTGSFPPVDPRHDR
jgi:hypothetical protein